MLICKYLNKILKSVYLIPLTLIIFSCNSKQNKAEVKKKVEEKKRVNRNISNEDFKVIKKDSSLYRFSLRLSGDSGFIYKKDGISALLSAFIFDTTDAYMTSIRQDDTIANYFKIKATGNFLVSFTFLNGGYFLLEIKSDGTVIKNQLYGHWNHPCGGNKFYKGVQKFDNYFYIQTNRTGSGYCSDNMYLFKNIESQDNQNSILEGYFLSMGEYIEIKNDWNSYILKSKMELKNDTVIMHYTFEKGVFDNKNKFKINHIEKFDVDYVSKNNTWEATDSSNIRNHYN